jgi:hypothetical protein
MNALKNPYVIFIATIFSLIAIGFLRSYSIYSGISKRLEYLHKFRNMFIDWCNGGFGNRELYTSLVSMSPKAQAVMGKWGVMDYRPPFANYMHTNWPIILNAFSPCSLFCVNACRITGSLARFKADGNAEMS